MQSLPNSDGGGIMEKVAPACPTRTPPIDFPRFPVREPAL